MIMIPGWDGGAQFPNGNCSPGGERLGSELEIMGWSLTVLPLDKCPLLDYFSNKGPGQFLL